MLQHFGRFGIPEVDHTDHGTAFHNELIAELLRVAGIEQSLVTAYSKEENAIVERANKEVLRYLNALLFDACVLTSGHTSNYPYCLLSAVQQCFGQTAPIFVFPLPCNSVLVQRRLD